MLFSFGKLKEKHSTMKLLFVACQSMVGGHRKTWYSNRDLILNQIRHLQRDPPLCCWWGKQIIGLFNAHAPILCKNGVANCVSHFEKNKFCSTYSPIHSFCFQNILSSLTLVCRLMWISWLRHVMPYLLFTATQFHATSISNAEPCCRFCCRYNYVKGTFLFFSPLFRVKKEKRVSKKTQHKVWFIMTASCGGLMINWFHFHF